jgi:hypothetical protein
VVDGCTDAEITQAVTAWQAWEDAIDKTRPQETPAWMKVNGRRWASDPGE